MECAILMVVDQLSKLAKMVPTKIIITTSTYEIFVRYMGQASQDAIIYHE